MNDPRWIDAYTNAFVMLTEAWEYRLVVSGIVTSVCKVFNMDATLAYCMFGTLTADMILRLAVLVQRRRSNRAHSICHGLKRGLPRYMQYMLFILLAWACQLSVNQAVGISIPLINLMMCYLVFQDVGSCVGHLKALGVPVPALLDRFLFVARRHVDARVDAHFAASGRHGEHLRTRQDGVAPNMPREPYTPAEHPHRRAEDRDHGEG